MKNKENLEQILLDNLFNLFFEKNFNIFGASAIDNFLSNPIKYNNIIDICAINDKDVCIIANSLKKLLSFSFDIIMNYKRYEEYDETSYDSEEDDNDEIIRIVKMSLTYKYAKDIYFQINVHHGPLTNLSLMFDFEGIYIPNKKTVSINTNNEGLKDYTLYDMIKLISNKQFKVFANYKVVNISRKELGLKRSTFDVLKFIDGLSLTASILNKGWTLNDQKLSEIFSPCLIKEVLNIEDQKCSICQNNLQKYELELDCCKQIMCFSCATEYIKSRADNTEIFCPFCKGDPFGCKTN